MIITKYKCTNPECEAEDSDHNPYTTPPRALICWNCKTGTRMTIEEQLRHGVGMLPELTN